MSYENWYGPGKGPADYQQDNYREGLRHDYIDGNRARLMPWAEYAMPDIAVGKDLIKLMPTKLLWALQSRWFMDPEVGWKAKETHFQKLIKFWMAGIPERVVARHIKFVLPDAEVEISDKNYAPFPGAHRDYVDDYDLKVTRAGETKYYEVKRTKHEFSMVNPAGHGPGANHLWVAKREQVEDKINNTHAWIWLNRNMTCMRLIKASTYKQWDIAKYDLSKPPELWYAAPLELWDFKPVRK